MGISWEKKRHDSWCTTDIHMRNLWQKAEWGKKTGTDSSTRFPRASFFEKARDVCQGRMYDVLLWSTKGIRKQDKKSDSYAAKKGGMVHANVGHKVMLITLSKGYFCANFYIQWSCDVTSPSTTTKETTNKHHHHGDGAARPSSGVDSLIPHHPRGRRPCAYSFQGRCRRILFDSIN